MIDLKQAEESQVFHVGTCRKFLGRGARSHLWHRAERTGPTVHSVEMIGQVEVTHWEIPVKSMDEAQGYSVIYDDTAYLWHTEEDCKPNLVLPSGTEITHDGGEVEDPLFKGRAIDLMIIDGEEVIE